MSTQLEVFLVPCLIDSYDNYAYVIRNDVLGKTAVVDVPEAAPILQFLGEKQWGLDAIFVTHSHFDHVQGIAEVKSASGARVYGAKLDVAEVPEIDEVLSGGDAFEWAGETIEVLDVPGHCEVQIAYYAPQAQIAFVGDALFSMGCGACFTGDYVALQDSMQKIASLPKTTKLYVGHEYTHMCGSRALLMEPDNAAIIERMANVSNLRSRGEPTLPTTVEMELATNPFLRVDSPGLRKALSLTDASDREVFRAVRDFRG